MERIGWQNFTLKGPTFFMFLVLIDIFFIIPLFNSCDVYFQLYSKYLDFFLIQVFFFSFQELMILSTNFNISKQRTIFTRGKLKLPYFEANIIGEKSVIKINIHGYYYHFASATNILEIFYSRWWFGGVCDLQLLGWFTQNHF